MNKLKPRNKICFQNNENIHANLKIIKLKKKKWNLLKKNLKIPFYKNNKKSISKFKNKKYQKKELKTNSILPSLKKNKTFIKPEEKKNFFKERLFAKQQLKFFYGCIPEYQLKNIFQNFKQKKNNQHAFKNFIIHLESRLDIILVRLRLVPSIFSAKQVINHNKISINGNKITSQNYILKSGDIISFENLIINHGNYCRLNYFEFNNKFKKAIFLRKPKWDEIKYPFPLNLKLIDEYLKKK